MHGRVGCMWALLAAGAAAGVPAWPQDSVSHPAEGFGASAKGGAEGRVLWVTNLNPAGPGSLREAVDATGPRVVKFKVAGTIELERDSIIIGGLFREEWEAGSGAVPNPHSYLTVDGSSAPGPGVTVSGRFFIRYGASHVILRHLRIRDNGYSSIHSAMGVAAGTGCRHLLIDHCSISWSRTKMVSFWGACGDATVQWCILSDANKGFLSGKGASRLTLHHNLFANNADRSPLVSGSTQKGKVSVRGNGTVDPRPVIDFRNNVIYNWHNVNASKINGSVRTNLVGNYYRPGPSSDPEKLCILVHSMAVCYLEGNVGPRRPNDEGDEWADAGNVRAGVGGPWAEGMRSDTPFPVLPVATHSAREARDLVLAQAGAWPRDPIDAGVVRTVLDGTGWAAVPNGRPEDFTNARPLASVATARAGGGVKFKGRAKDRDGKVISYTWHFGEGSCGVGPAVAHTYGAPGAYVATLFAMDDQGMTGTARARLTVRAGRPVAVEAIKLESVSAVRRPEPTAGQPPTTVKVPRAPRRIADGAFPSADAWRLARPIGPFIDHRFWREAEDGDVEGRALHDGARLYLQVTSANPWPGSIRPIQEFDAERRVRGGVEVYLSPVWGKAPWFNFEVSRYGTTYDAKMFDRDWDPPAGWQARSRADGGKWTVEVSVPFRSFGMASARRGSSCGLKLCRMRVYRQTAGGGPWATSPTVIWPSLASSPEDGHRTSYTPDPAGYAKLVLE